MAAFLLELAIRATLVAGGTALVLRVLRIQAASIRHAAWTGVVIVMLCLPAWTASGAKLALPVLSSATDQPAISPPSVTPTPTPSVQPQAALDPAASSPSIGSKPVALKWPTVLTAVYVAVAFILLVRLGVGTWQANRLRRRALLRTGRLTTFESASPPQHYSEYLLDMARAVTRGHGRVHFVGMAMPGHGLTERLRHIFDGLPSARVSRTRAICTVALCAISAVLFSAGMPATRAQAPAVGQALAADMQITFEVVSIKPCPDSTPEAGGRGSNVKRGSFSPGYAHFACESLATLVHNAWGGFFPVNDLANTLHLPPGMRTDLPKRVRGGPDWVEDERWEIEIRLSGDTTALTGSARVNHVREAMRPALRAMLLDRFQLKLRKATEQRPMYAMTVAAGGLKIQQTAAANERCWEIPPDRTRGTTPVPPPGSESLPPCRFGFTVGMNRGNHIWNLSYVSLKDFAKELSETVDRYVLDQTGVSGRFTFRLEYAPDERTPGDTDNPIARLRAERRGTSSQPGDGPSIFKALEALGLKLDSTTGPAEYLLIESAQKPKERTRP